MTTTKMAYHSNGYVGTERPDHNDRNYNKSNKPAYLIEHLATFTVTSDTGIVYPADGMRRLLQLEKSNGIWSQKMQLCLDHPWVLIMDYETGTVMERFPLSLIQEPTAFTSHDPMEIYNNILVFIVGSSGMGHNPYPEMHIFQCQSISAQDLVEDLKHHKNEKTPTGHKNSSISPVPAENLVPSIIGSAGINRGEMSVINPYRETDLEVTGINDEASSTTSEKYERDVAILNHCFDDIEKFIARLQHAAAASRELERRRRNRKSKKKDLGDGMLTMRTKPPPEKDFIDIFQKFKLSFNLLAKLKAHIHDPNAPELIHFLFTPLALIVDASHETFYDPHLTAKVVSPLLTREAINLLMNCVTSKETELWHSLGNSWLIPRDQWKGHVTSYYPVFMDGWSPDYQVTDEIESTLEIKHRRNSNEDTHYNNDFFEYEQPVNELNRLILDKRNSESPQHDLRESKMELMVNATRESLREQQRDMGARSDISADSIERTGCEQENWLSELQARDANIVQVTYPRTANNDKELTVVRGEFLEVLDDARKWWKARNWRGLIAHVPHTIVAPYHYEHISNVNEANDIFNNPLYSQNYNRNHGDPVSSTFSSTQTPSIQEHQGPNVAQTDWVIKERLGKKDRIPPAPIPPPMPNDKKSILKNTGKNTPLESNFQDDNIDHNFFSSNNNSEVANNNFEMTNNNISVHDVLKNVLPRFTKNIPKLDIARTPQVFIQPDSSPAEVQDWLQKKRFSDSLCKALSDLDGDMLLSLTREELEQHYGAEGKRLASQITLQKEICGFTVGRTSELKNVLQKARTQADNDDHSKSKIGEEKQIQNAENVGDKVEKSD